MLILNGLQENHSEWTHRENRTIIDREEGIRRRWKDRVVHNDSYKIVSGMQSTA